MTQEEKQKIISYMSDEFKESPSLDSLLSICEIKLSKSFFGDKFYYACSLFISHKITLQSRPKGASGSLTSVGEYGLSMSFSGGSFGSYGELSSTTYGLELAELAGSMSNSLITGML